MKTRALWIAGALLAIGSVQSVQAQESPLDPSFRARMIELRGNFFNMLKDLDKNGDGLINESEYCSVAGDDPLSPAYKKRQAEFKEMIAKMDAGKDGTLCLEDYMAVANPLHPGHKR